MGASCFKRYFLGWIKYQYILISLKWDIFLRSPMLKYFGGFVSVTWVWVNYLFWTLKKKLRHLTKLSLF